MNLVERFFEQAKAHPQLPAIIEASQGIDYQELSDRCASGMVRLRELGLVPGQRVVVFIPMGSELYEVLLAIIGAGLTAVFLDPSAKRDYIARCCERVRPDAFIGVPKAHILRLFHGCLRRIPLAISTAGGWPGIQPWRRSNGAPPPKLHPCAPEHPALITFTSGSTGQPKAAVRSHGFLEAQHDALAESLAHRSGEVDLTTLPIFVLGNLASGLTSLLPDADLRRPGAIDAAPVLRQLQRHRPFSTAASPAFLECLAAEAESQNRELEGFHRIYTGGAPVFPALLERVQRLCPTAEVVAVYGSTEAEPIAEIPYREMAAEDLRAMKEGMGLLAGRPVPRIQIGILGNRWGEHLTFETPEAFEQHLQPPGAIGEIVVSGDHVLKGYLNGEGDSETKIHVGREIWHRTGDLGRLDDRGRLWLLGRCSALFQDGKGTLYPFALECAAMQLAGVRRAALVPGHGMRLLAVEFHPDAWLEEGEIRESLAWAHLDRVLILERIPLDRRHNAKIDYPELDKLVRKRLKGGPR